MSKLHTVIFFFLMVWIPHVLQGQSKRDLKYDHGAIVRGDSTTKQIAIIFQGTNGLLREVPLDKIREFEDLYLTSLSSRYGGVLDNLRAGKLLDDDINIMKSLAAELKTQYKA